MLSEKALQKIAAQRCRYIESMPVKRKAIAQCMALVNQAVRDDKSELCDKLFQQVHRLAGSAGSYGFEQLGQAASVVDRYLTANSPRVADLPELEGFLQKLLDEIDEVIRKHG